MSSRQGCGPVDEWTRKRPRVLIVSVVRFGHVAMPAYRKAPEWLTTAVLLKCIAGNRGMLFGSGDQKDIWKSKTDNLHRMGQKMVEYPNLPEKKFEKKK